MNLEERRNVFGNCSKMSDALDIVGDKELGHKSYSFYTSLDRVQSMLTGKVRCIWLTRVDSDLFDDLIEAEKYGDKAKAKQKKTFIKCFSYGFRESAAMWGLYCPTTYKAICVSLTKKAIDSILEGRNCFKISKVKKPHGKIKAEKEFVDVVYAAVKSNEDEEGRSNKLYWNGVFSKEIACLEKDRRIAPAVARVKDIEWSFENEARLIATTAQKLDKVDHIAIELTPEFIEGMSFTLSPWINDEEESFVKGRIVKWLGDAGRKHVSASDARLFRSSVLKGALKQWAERRGLA